MSSTLPIFSNMNYYKNPTFVKLMRKWNKYLLDDIDDEKLCYEIEETLMFDMWQEARKWLKENKNKTYWRKDIGNC
jgi:hypothetical protein